MSEANKAPTPEEIAEHQAKAREQYQQRIGAVAGHVIAILQLTGASPHAIAMVGSHLVGFGIDGLAKEDRDVAERVAKDLASGFVQVINNLGIKPETEKAD